MDPGLPILHVLDLGGVPQPPPYNGDVLVVGGGKEGHDLEGDGLLALPLVPTLSGEVVLDVGEIGLGGHEGGSHGHVEAPLLRPEDLPGVLASLPCRFDLGGNSSEDLVIKESHCQHPWIVLIFDAAAGLDDGFHKVFHAGNVGKALL